jgi:hypothetical protein
MNIGTVETGEVTILDYQKQPDATVTLAIFCEDSSVVQLLVQQAALTHMVIQYDTFQSSRKYHDMSPDQRNILPVSLECGTLTIDGLFMQLDLKTDRTPGSLPGWILTYQLANLGD